jgi:hypothetical protein
VPVAPEISAHAVAEVHRCHSRVNEGAGDPDHEPSDSVNVEPCTADPDTVGNDVFTGADVPPDVVTVA